MYSIEILLYTIGPGITDPPESSCNNHAGSLLLPTRQIIITRGR